MEICSLIVLAGGSNSRLQPLASTAYKAFIPIHGASIAARQALQAHFAGIGRVFLVSDEPDPLAAIVAADSPGDVTHVLVSGTTADKVLGVVDLYPDCRPAAISLGDTFVKFDITELARVVSKGGVDSALCLTRLRLPYGAVEVDGDLVIAFDEKPVTPFLINAGYVLLGEAGLAALADTRDMTATLSRLALASALGYVVVSGEAIAIDTLPLLADAHARLTAVEHSQTRDGTSDG